jgi:hypothetical protein
VATAKAVCARCPVRTECLAAALVRIPYGIAGGLTDRERRRLRQTTGTRQVAVGRAVVGAAGEVWIDGRCAGWTRAQRAGTGRALLAAGRPASQVARACGVSTRTVQRWATTTATPVACGTASGTDTSASSTPGVGEGSHGGHRAPLGPPTPSTPRQAHDQRKDIETR